MTTYPLAANSSGFHRYDQSSPQAPSRAAVDEELHGILLRGIEVRRLDEEALDFVAVSAGEPEGLERGHGDLREDGVVQVGELFACGEVVWIDLRGRDKLLDFGRPLQGHAREEKSLAIPREDEIVVVPAGDSFGEHVSSDRA